MAQISKKTTKVKALSDFYIDDNSDITILQESGLLPMPLAQIITEDIIQHQDEKFLKEVQQDILRCYGQSYTIDQIKNAYYFILGSLAQAGADTWLYLILNSTRVTTTIREMFMDALTFINLGTPMPKNGDFKENTELSKIYTERHNSINNHQNT